MRIIATFAAALLLVASAIPAAATTGPRPVTELISRTPTGDFARSGGQCWCDISYDGRYIVFETWSTELGAPEGRKAIVVHDRSTRQTTVASHAYPGAEGDGKGEYPSISADGRYVAFESDSWYLVPGDTNSGRDIFVRDMQSGVTERVSVASSGAQANSSSYWADISGDGRYVTFMSYATNLTGSPTGSGQIYVHDRQTDQTILASQSTAGQPANGLSSFPSISHDGRIVAFGSVANNLTPGDSNGTRDIYARDIVAGTTERISVNSQGAGADDWSDSTAVSGNGQYVAFYSRAQNLAPGAVPLRHQVYVHDRVNRTTTLVSKASDGTAAERQSVTPHMSHDGRYIAFSTSATNLWEDDTNFVQDVGVFDQQTGRVSRVSLTADHRNPNSSSGLPLIAGDGSLVVWYSGAGNIIAGDDNGTLDVFARTWLTAPTPPEDVAAGAWTQPGQTWLRWDPPMSDGGAPITNYRIYRSDSSRGPFTPIADTAATATTYNETRPLGSISFYKIAAVNQYGESDPSPLVCTPAGPGSPPINHPLQTTICSLLP